MSTWWNFVFLGHKPPSSFLHHDIIAKTIQTEEDKGDSSYVHFSPEESALALLSHTSCNQEVLKCLATSKRTLEYASSEAESLEKEETSSASTEEDDTSDLESSENGLEPGEISLVRRGKIKIIWEYLALYINWILCFFGVNSEWYKIALDCCLAWFYRAVGSYH